MTLREVAHLPGDKVRFTHESEMVGVVTCVHIQMSDVVTYTVTWWSDGVRHVETVVAGEVESVHGE